MRPVRCRKLKRWKEKRIWYNLISKGICSTGRYENCETHMVGRGHGCCTEGGRGEYGWKRGSFDNRQEVLRRICSEGDTSQGTKWIRPIDGEEDSKVTSQYVKG